MEGGSLTPKVNNIKLYYLEMANDLHLRQIERSTPNCHGLLPPPNNFGGAPLQKKSEGSSELCALGGREIKELTIHYVLFLLSLNFDN